MSDNPTGDEVPEDDPRMRHPSHPPHSHGHFMSMYPLNEEDMQRIQMEKTEYRHAMFRLFDELNEEQLIQMVKLFDICSDEDNGHKMADHYQGVTMGILHLKHNVCLSCGVNHDREASELGGLDADS